ncbi:hypothetical protein B5C34_01100 [Pacificimonas flava]|uniref:EF-hand domain-containing protein n=2 Tax=Pacificimonas TaxID=1960290 RepID=A0A219B1V2_9SPHN|nr:MULTISPECIES: hypothetical protein [Pacificimonas]MBZ6378188.1 hypothetical protein [Pacificimonas aurantium]OWV32184.1 hypothetical protein B5C34_01100 [Pacificimonas flava]
MLFNKALSTRTPLFAAIASTVALAACGSGADEADTVPDDTIGMEDESGMDTEDAMLGNDLDGEMQDGMMAGEETTYLVDETDEDEVTVAEARPSSDLEAMRATPMTAEQTERRSEIDTDEVSADTSAEVRARSEAGEPLYDPAMDGDASFASLDRDNNGRLSIAEFAVYDLANVNPTMKEGADDQTRPYVSTEAINMATDDFVRLDTDGDYFLSREEFRPAGG